MGLATFAKNLLRIALTGAAMVGIAAGFLVLHPSEKEEGGLEVESSRADIAWMTGFEPSNTQRFAAALEQLGHEPPRVYDLNGNEVYFSTRTTRKRPEQLIREYQRAFVEQGLNSKEHLMTDRALSEQRFNPAVLGELNERAEAAMSGEILPASVSDDYLAMHGTIIENGPDQVDEVDEQELAETVEELEDAEARLSKAYEICNGDPARLDPKEGAQVARTMGDTDKFDRALQKQSSCAGGGKKACSEWRWRIKKTKQRLGTLREAIESQPEVADCTAVRNVKLGIMEHEKRQFTQRIKGVRAIEAFRREDTGETMVTAMWSNDEFDMTTVLPDQYGFPDDAELSIPLCHSCKPAWTFSGTGAEADYATEQVWSNDSVDHVSSQYINLLVDKGWKFQESDRGTDTAMRGIESSKEGGKWLRFMRGDIHLKLHLVADRERKRTEVTAFKSN